LITLRLLGGAGLDGPSGPVAGPATQRKRLALLALLTLAPDRRLSRDRVIAFLWPESPSESARHQLSSALYEIRKAAGDDAISAVGDELTLNPAVIRPDVAEFEASLAAGDVVRAVALYRGPFLDGFFLSDAPEFEHWADAERSRLADGYARALETLAQVAEDQGHGPAAVDWWKTRAAHDPYDSRVALRLMRALDAVGNRAGALQHAAIHERLLREEFDAAPDPELVALVGRLRSASSERLDPGATHKAGVGAGAESGSADHRAPQRRVDLDLPGPPYHPSRPLRSRTARVLGRWGTPLALLALGGLAVIMAAFWLTQQASPSVEGRRVVVAPFENRTGDAALDPIGSMVADRIAGGISRQNGVNVVLASVESPVADQATSGLAGNSNASAEYGRQPDMALIISGSFYRRGDSLQFHTRITDASDRRLVRSLEPVTGTRADPALAVDEVGQRAAAAAAIVLDTRLAQLGNLSSAPANYDAYHACMDGLDPFLASDWPVATRQFERALELDATYLFPLLHIGYIRLNLGDLAAADSIVGLLNRSREHMMPFELAILDLLGAYVAEDPVASYEAAERAAAIGPGSPPHAQWGAEALRLNRPREAIRILSAIAPEAAPVGGWPLYWTTLTASYHQLGRHRAELRQARRARAMHPNESWPLLLEARALAARGRTAALEPLILERKSLPDHHPPRPGEMMAAIGRELRVHGHGADSRAWFERAVDWHRTRGAEERDRAAHRQELAFILVAMGRSAEAEAIFRDLALEDPDHVAVLGALGVLAAQRGDTVEAEQVSHRLATRRRPYNVGDRLLWRACVAAHAGDPPGALALLREAAGRGARFEHTSICLDPLRYYPPFREFVRSKE
jgi:DNA-binding SARP family transcriptional activator/tetratricopeptide (TPR) repeat protein/TolB-like protein